MLRSIANSASGFGQGPFARRWMLAGLALCLLASGCQSEAWITLRETPSNPLVERLSLASWWGPEPSDRTQKTLRRYGLDPQAKATEDVLSALQKVISYDPSPEVVFAFSEISYLAGKQNELTDRHAALDFYCASATSAYRYLFGPRFDAIRNPYDPQYRGVCDMYNEALESALRIMQEEGALKPGATATVKSAKTTWEVTVVRRSGRWEYKDFDEFKFVSDFEVNGFANHNGTYGLGVPLIAVRNHRDDASGYERYFPNKLSFPVTAFMRVLPEDLQDAAGGQRRRALLELYDPMVGADIMVGQTRAPLESDLTTPLAYLLNASKIDEFSTLGLLRPDKSEKLAGLIMTQPYEPDKIPVLFVHGLWSDPSAWAEMFNELLNDRTVRDNYQFWFYMYPTGQPFWVSAAELRDNLRTMRETLDPERRNPNLDRMVLVGHSMGGLVSKLQIVEGGDTFWGALSEKPFQTVKASEKVKAQLAGLFYFHPNSSVSRIVTIATPHRGSAFANPATQWLFGKLISLPQALVEGQTELYRDNPGLFRSNSFSRVRTSIDSLSPKSPLLPVLLTAKRYRGVRVHNIIGQEYEDATGDGIVSLASAHLDDADSELMVRAKHTTIHSVPLTILEVRRILRDHLIQSRRPFPDFRREPRVYQTSGQQTVGP